jgi:inorganic phosphate transporter, PiT family
VELALVYVLLATAFGLFMAWGIGANDVANAMAPAVGSRSITIPQAIVIAGIFEFAGAVLAGGEVTATIRKGIVDADLFAGDPELLVIGMLASLLAGGIWLTVASRFGWPVSTTHSIVGAVVGFAAMGMGIEAVYWGQVGRIVLSWIASPVVAGIFALALFFSIQRLVLGRDDPIAAARRWCPWFVFLAGFFMTGVTLLKGVVHLGLNVGTGTAYALATVVGLAVALLNRIYIARIPHDPAANREFHFSTVEKIFAVPMVVIACAMAFAHGSNDVANAVGPVAAVVSIASTGEVGATSNVSPWLLLLGGIGIVIGLATYGHRVIATVGQNITQLTPSRGFAAGIASAATIVLASGTGLPISTTHTLVGAVLGVGMARGIAAINMRVVGTIFVSWLVTVPAGAVLAAMLFFLGRALLI